MLKLETPVIELKKSPQEIFTFLSDFNNYNKIMPDNVVDWRATADECSFNIKGLARLSMKFKEKTPNTSIKIEQGEKAAINFLLNCDIAEAPGGSTVKMGFEADMNPFIKMMAEKPLQNFMNLLATKLKATFDAV